ncbi:uncharacterized protein LOC114244433 [Bombyx mandarina]|uniref:Uncharacterized protein LOC114244433 n=1 Tax=Bombyx mandarina TaxID=7092 RepID=A0A6J2JV08_BOMMA|nr:uncharacterized protein LOC114244433 [Bombyx mandarina]
MKFQQTNCRVPIVRKCCFCVPIRRGITIFGYVNLALSLLSLPLLVILLVEQVGVDKTLDTSHIDPLVHLPLTITFIIVDVVMTILLLIGAHKKKKCLLKAYLYFGIVFQLVTLLVDLVYFDYREYVENTIYFFFLGLNVYLLFLVYSVVRLLEQNSEVQYVAHRHEVV